MLHARPFAVFLLFVVIAIVLFWPSRGRSTSVLRRITNTTEEGLSLNPSISGDGHHIAFESTEDVAHLGGNSGFRALRADISLEPAVFAQIETTRAVAPAISQDGSRIAFASTDDLVGKNSDRNSEIFLFDGSALRQITNSTPADLTTRVHDGNFQPSITDDGSFIAFSSNRDLVGLNADLNFEIFLFNTTAASFTQLTASQGIEGGVDAKISGDGSHIAYVRDAGTSPTSHRDLLLHDRTSGATAMIANGVAALSLTYGRAISDDGLRVVYSAETAENQSQLFLFDGRSNLTRQITSLGTRSQDVPLHPTISGDGKRVAFATRRKVSNGTGDGSVELYVFDIPTAQFIQLTDAPSTATGKVVSSLNDDGTMAIFNFPRVLSGPVSSSELANNSEIYATAIATRPASGVLAVLNGASLGNEPSTIKGIAPASIGIAQGNALASGTEQAQRLTDGSFPLSLERTTVMLNGRAAQVLYVSPTQVNFVAPPEIQPGPADLVITNADGFQSKASVTILPAAPGVFTISGDGRGEGIILNADSLLGGPFDPSDNKLRLVIFATGMHRSTNISVLIAGWALPAESSLKSPDLPGLDEIHVLVPSGLRGAGTVDLIVAADNHESNLVTVALTGSSQREIVINEILADPPDGIAGDANHDGVRDSSHDEFVELVNTTARDLDISDYELQSRGSSSNIDVLRHRFALGTVFPAGTAMVVFGGGNPEVANVAFGGAQILKASTGGLSLLNSGGVVTLRDASAAIITFLSYGGSTGLRGDANQSLTRAPDITGNFTLHQSAPESGATLFSPGTHLNGKQFPPSPTISQILISPLTANLHPGEELQFMAGAFGPKGAQLNDIIFSWKSNSVSVVTIDRNGLARAVGTGTAQVVATARGVQSSASALTVATPTPTPTPSPSPSPSTFPSPSPSPSPETKVVISQIYGGGGNSSAPFKNDFIELFNSGATTVSLAGWSVQYGTATSNAWSVTNLTSVLLAPGQYYLIQESSAGATGANLPAADATGTIAMSATAGKVALLNTTTVLSGACSADSSIIDLVGYGTSANCFKGSGPAGVPSNTTSILRENSGCLDTQNNLTDFVTGAPNPRNTSFTTNPCGGLIPPTAISEQYHNHWREFLTLLFAGTSLGLIAIRIGLTEWKSEYRWK